MARYGDLETLAVKWIQATPTQKQNFKQIIDTHPTADVAREIFEEIEKIDEDTVSFQEFYSRIMKLKKKYTENENG